MAAGIAGQVASGLRAIGIKPGGTPTTCSVRDHCIPPLAGPALLQAGGSAALDAGGLGTNFQQQSSADCLSLFTNLPC